MQSEKIIPINHDVHSILSACQKTYKVKELLKPGQRVTIAPWISMEIEYYLEHGEFQTRFKFWYGKKRVKDYYPDSNNQIDMRHSCRRIITLKSTEYTELTHQPLMSVVEIETVEFY